MSTRLSGTVTYDHVPAVATEAADGSYVGGLDYARTVRKPIRGAVVQALDAANPNGAALAQTTSSETGAYELSWSGEHRQVILRVRAETTEPPVEVVDNTQAGAAYVLDSPSLDMTTTSTLDLGAASGWTGQGYGAPRAAAPFAVLDTMYTAGRAFIQARPSAAAAFARAPLTVNWSENNVPEDGDKSRGQIGTSHWDREQLYVLGASDIDTDEYDAHIIAHEWGHYFESTQSRSDSPGGQHGAGDLKDLRLAFGEGWGNALSAMVLSPDALYVDTMRERQASVGVRFDLEANDRDDPYPGPWSESSVMHVLYDLFDDSGSREPFDGVALGLGPIYDAMVGPQRETPALTTIFSFIDAVKRGSPASAAAIDTLTAYVVPDGRLGTAYTGGPVVDAWGTGDTSLRDGSGQGRDFYIPISAGSTLTVTGLGAASEQYNDLFNNVYFRFTGNGARMTVSAATAGQPVALFVLRNGAEAATPAEGARPSVTLSTVNGAEHVIVLTGEPQVAPYDVNVSLTSP